MSAAAKILAARKSLSLRKMNNINAMHSTRTRGERKSKQNLAP
jgi:hypothetical protein